MGAHRDGHVPAPTAAALDAARRRRVRDRSRLEELMAHTLQIRNTDDHVKIRSPWAVALLPIVTLGIYHLVWWYRINRDLRDYGRAKGYDLGQNPVNSLLARSRARSSSSRRSSRTGAEPSASRERRASPGRIRSAAGLRCCCSWCCRSATGRICRRRSTTCGVRRLTPCPASRRYRRARTRCRRASTPAHTNRRRRTGRPSPRRKRS